MIKECLCESMQEITELRSNGQNTQAKWKQSQRRHQRKCHQNNRRRKKKGKQIDKRSQKRHVDPEQKDLLQQCTNRKQKESREEFLVLKSSLNKIENEKLEKAKESAQA